MVQSGDIDAAEELLRCNKNVEEYIDQRNSQLNTPLHIACQRGQLGMVKLLKEFDVNVNVIGGPCLLYTSPSPRDRQKSRMPSSA